MSLQFEFVSFGNNAYQANSKTSKVAFEQTNFQIDLLRFSLFCFLWFKEKQCSVVIQAVLISLPICHYAFLQAKPPTANIISLCQKLITEVSKKTGSPLHPLNVKDFMDKNLNFKKTWISKTGKEKSSC